MQITITIDGVPEAVRPFELKPFEPAPTVTPKGFVLVADDLLALYRDLAAAALHAVEASSQLQRSDFPVGMLMPAALFDLLVNVAGKVEAADPAAPFPSVTDLQARYCCAAPPPAAGPPPLLWPDAAAMPNIAAWPPEPHNCLSCGYRVGTECECGK